MKHYFTLSALPLLAAMATALAACSDLNDEYGCEADLTLRFDGYSNYTTQTFDANFTIDAAIINLNGETVEEAGIMSVFENVAQLPTINKTYPVEAMRGTTGGTYSVTIPGLQYGASYTFRPYLKTASTTMIALAKHTLAGVQQGNVLSISEVSNATVSDDCMAVIVVTLSSAELAATADYECGLEITGGGLPAPFTINSKQRSAKHTFTVGHLRPGTYAYRAFLNTKNGGKKYADTQKSFTVEGYIDLGLSVKWAACNLAAAYCDAPIEGTLYRFPSKRDQVKIADSDDMATMEWGTDWRLPTEAEASELIGKCTWSFTTYEGKKGWRVTGPSGRSIFLPLSKTRDYMGTSDGKHTPFWLSDNAHVSTASWYSANTWVNSALYIDETGYSITEVADLYWQYQLPVRAVRRR